MATIYYTLSSKRNALGQSEIMMRFSHGKINQRAKTGLFVSPAYWADGAIRIPNFRMRPSAEVQAEVNDSVETQKRLAEITSLVRRAFNGNRAGKRASELVAFAGGGERRFKGGENSMAVFR